MFLRIVGHRMNQTQIEDMVLWQDTDFIVINKPAGLPALPDGYHPGTPHLVSLLAPLFGSLMIVHRLDRETSGLIILARSPQAHQLLSIQFEKRQVSKFYHAIVEGNPSWEEKAVNLKLRADGDRRHRTVVDRRYGKSALTQLKVMERFGMYSLVEAMPQTGRTHQIRAHLAAVGHPVAVDGLYGSRAGIFLSRLRSDYIPGKSEERPLLSRLGLHAWSMKIIHPGSGELCTFEAPYPLDLAITLKQLRKYASRSL